MIVPRHWAQARLQERREKKQITVYRFGWSNECVEAAQAMAEARAREALARLWSGAKLPRRDPKVPYNGAEGVPIREEIVAEHGATIITRNGYGARCLNTPDVLIADVDFEPRGVSRGLVVASAVVGLASAAAVVAAGSPPGGAIVLGLLAIGALHALVVPLVRRLRRGLADGDEALALALVTTFVQTHPKWRLHVYRTPVGLRVIATHRRFSPGEPEVLAFFEALRVDPLYAAMCTRQRCFRARLTAKPWRIGIEAHLKPRPGVWPVKAERRPERERWVDAYETAAAGYAACRYLQPLGDGQPAPDAERVRLLHDELSGATSGRPLA